MTADQMQKLENEYDAAAAAVEDWLDRHPNSAASERYCDLLDKRNRAYRRLNAALSRNYC